MAGGFHHHIPHEIAGQCAQIGQNRAEILQFLFTGQRAEQQKISGLFKSAAVIPHGAGYQIAHVNSAVQQLALAGNTLTVLLFERFDRGDVGQSGQHTFAVYVAQSFFYVVLCI